MVANAERAPMTEAEARENIAAMRSATKVSAQVKMIRLALGPLGNLTDAARAVYRARLDELE